MAAIVTNKSVAFAIVLNTGTDSSGNMITKSTSMPKAKSGADVDKILAISKAFEQIAEAPVYAVRRTVVNILTD